MRRLLLSACLAMILHALFLSTDAAWMKRGQVPALRPEPLAVTLEYYRPPKRSLPKIEEPRIIEKKPAPIQSTPKKEEPKPERPKKVKAPSIKPVTRKPPEPLARPTHSPPAVEESPPAKEKETETENASPTIPASRPEVPLEPPQSEGYEEAQTPDLASIPAEPVAKTAPLPIREAIPAYQKNPSPVYPTIARRMAYQGTVVMEVLVNRKGRVEELRLFQSSGYAVLDRSAMKAVRGWVFEPGRRGDEQIDMWVKVPIRFQLR